MSCVPLAISALARALVENELCPFCEASLIVFQRNCVPQWYPILHLIDHYKTHPLQPPQVDIYPLHWRDVIFLCDRI